ncbi:MAG: uracil-DNA glycosylase [Clostridiales bacterium]|jgi:uracil-DNA glycosylase|nr:uracil-DNA glycosylase [Clostridiales bacterium]
MRKNLIGNDWDQILHHVFISETYAELRMFLIQELSAHTIYPDRNDIFNALKLTPPDKVKVVIIGQDPYINPNQAHGLAFSVENAPPPPSLVNIFKEISDDLGIPEPKSGCLIPWANQGVLLLNSVLTTRAGISNSHQGKGWEQFTGAVVKSLVTRNQPIAFLLWGRNAQNMYTATCKELGVPYLFANHPVIKVSETKPVEQIAAIKPAKTSNRLVLTAPHPSPFSANSGFFGCKHFSKTNRFLESNNIPPINWTT